MTSAAIRLAGALFALIGLSFPVHPGQLIVAPGGNIVFPAAGSSGGLILACTDLVVQGGVSVGAATVSGAGNLSISAGGTLNGGSGSISVGGSWSNGGTFVPGASTVAFVDGCLTATAQISGNTAFANLSLVSTAGRTFTIPPGAATSVSGTLRATGTVEKPIQIVSSDTSQPSYIALGANAFVVRENTVLGPNVSIGKPSFALTVTKGGAGSGSVTSTPAGIACDGACTSSNATFELGTTVSLTAIASAGSNFAGWGGACSGTGACQVAMDAAKSVSAQFSLVAIDTTPDPFSFNAQTGVTPGAVVQSNAVTIAGINAAAPISVTGGSYSIGCNEVFTSSPATIQAGQNVCVRGGASSQSSTTTSVILTVGGVSGAFSITTGAPPADTTAPQIISGPFVTGLSANAATISWLTNEEATSELTFAGGTLTSTVYRTSHVLTLSGLTPGAVVFAVVRSVDRAGNSSASKTVTFTTTQAADTTPPAFLEGPVVVGISTDRATVKWKTDEPATSVVTGGATGVVPGFRTDHEVSLGNLAAATRYTVAVLSADAANNAATPRSLSFTTLAAPDTTAPQIVKGPLVVDVGSDYLTVAWDTDEAATSRLSVDGGTQSLVRADDSTKTSHRLRVGGLLPSTSYLVRASSIDAFGNGPTVSSALSITTAAAPDTAAPVFTEAVSVCQVGDTFLLLCFRTDEPSSASVAYGVSGGALNLTASRASLLQAQTVSVTGLTPGTAYQLRVTVTDAAANSATGATLAATTAASAPSPLQITSGPRIAWATVDRVVVTWITSRPATSVVEYGTTAFDRQVSDGQLTTEHSIVVTGLTAGATYQFRARSTDVAGLSVEADVGASAPAGSVIGALAAPSFTVPVTPDTTPPVFTQSPSSAAVGPTAARVTWTTNELGDAVVRFGTSPSALIGLVADIEFATSHSVALTKLAPDTTYYYQVTTADPVGNTSLSGLQSFKTALQEPAAVTRLINISTRGPVQTGNDVMIGGFVIGGSTPKKVLITARGPSLASFGISNPLANPKIELFSGQTKLMDNDNWQTQIPAAGGTASVTAIQALGTFPGGLAPSNPAESALLVTLNPGAYTAIVSGADGGTGVGIVEVFEQDGPSIPLINISTRGRVGTDTDVMIGGFVVTGSTPQTVLITARGPSLASFGITSPLSDPKLEIFSGQTKLYENNDWQTQAAIPGGQAPSPASAISSLGVFPSGLAPSDAKEAALLITLPPGAYTAIVSGVNGATGVGIVEVFAR